MTAIVLPFHRPLSIGELLDATFRLFRLSLGKCALLALAAVVIGQLPTAIDLVRGTSPLSLEGRGAGWFAIALLTGLANMLVWAVLLLRQNTIAQGGTTQFGAEFAETLRRAPGTLAVVIIATIPWLLIVVGAMGLVALVAQQLNVLPLLKAIPPLALTVLPVLLLPGLWLAVVLWFAVPARVLSRLSVSGSVRHSFTLVAGNWWRSVTVLTVASFAVMVFYALGGMVGLLIAQLIASSDVAVFALTTTTVLAMLGGVFMLFLVALGVVQYADLGVRRQGDDLAARIDALERPA